MTAWLYWETNIDERANDDVTIRLIFLDAFTSVSVLLTIPSELSSSFFHDYRISIFHTIFSLLLYAHVQIYNKSIFYLFYFDEIWRNSMPRPLFRKLSFICVNCWLLHVDAPKQMNVGNMSNTWIEKQMWENWVINK